MPVSMSATTTLVLPRWVSQAFGAPIFAMPQSWPLSGEYQSLVAVSAMWNVAPAAGATTGETSFANDESDRSWRASSCSTGPRAGRKRTRDGREARADGFVQRRRFMVILLDASALGSARASSAQRAGGHETGSNRGAFVRTAVRRPAPSEVSPVRSANPTHAPC